jgi:hypothetical protein
MEKLLQQTIATIQQNTKDEESSENSTFPSIHERRLAERLHQVEEENLQLQVRTISIYTHIK